jgi:hypothetical protein
MPQILYLQIQFHAKNTVLTNSVSCHKYCTYKFSFHATNTALTNSVSCNKYCTYKFSFHATNTALTNSVSCNKYCTQIQFMRRRKHCICITQTNWVPLCSEIIAVTSGNRIKFTHINIERKGRTLCCNSDVRRFPPFFGNVTPPPPPSNPKSDCFLDTGRHVLIPQTPSFSSAECCNQFTVFLCLYSFQETTSAFLNE